MATYQIVEIDPDTGSVIHPFVGGNLFELANAVDAIAAGTIWPVYAEVLGDGGEWQRQELPPPNFNFDESEVVIEDDYLLDGNRWILRITYLREQGMCENCIQGGLGPCTCKF